MNKSNIVIIGLVVLGVIIASSTFMVNETERAIKLELGAIKSVDFDPGLHFKVPLFNNIVKLDARIQTLDAPPAEFITGEKKYVDVDSFVKWKIGPKANDVKSFYVEVQGNIGRANLLLSQIVKDSLRGEFAKRTLQQVISTDRNKIMGIVKADISVQAKKFGLDIVDVKIKRVDFSDKLSKYVYNRMNAERERIAKEHRSQGREAGERIRAEADRQRTVLLAKAHQESEDLRGNGDAKAIEIYAKAYGADKEFYQFYRSLEAYKKSFSNDGNLMMLNPNSDFFKYFGKKSQ